ncbi:hypothetical protein C1H46_019985 [Malus baccata]|uniref:Uncharacterized protein n=1 Tax=Malus baccata TaxID=106549 RepID=A0A540M6Q6_MALBA|nr:hypothetical protein C1H46_019985 [Malus baccata]
MRELVTRGATSMDMMALTFCEENRIPELHLSNTCDRSFTSPGTDARLQIESIPDFSVMWCKLGQVRLPL